MMLFIISSLEGTWISSLSVKLNTALQSLKKTSKQAMSPFMHPPLGFAKKEKRNEKSVTSGPWQGIWVVTPSKTVGAPAGGLLIASAF